MKEELEKLSFEELMDRLEKIASELEKGNKDLDESVKMFEEGMEVSKQCNQRLEAAEKKITILLNKDNSVVEEDLLPKD